MHQGFTGFDEDAAQFLIELQKDNTREWFERNRARHAEVWLAPASQLVEALGAQLKKLTPKVEFEAKADRSLVRLNRDMRFATTPGPYKTHFELRFWTGDRQSPAYALKLSATQLQLSAGIPFFETALLTKYRKAVAGAAGVALAKAEKALARAGLTLGGQRYLRVPKAYPADHPRGALLMHDGLYALHAARIPRELSSARFVDYCVARYRAMQPVMRWLEHLG